MFANTENTERIIRFAEKLLRKISLRLAESMPILTEQQSRFTKMLPIHWKKDITRLPKKPFLPRKNRKIKLIYTDFRAQTNL